MKCNELIGFFFKYACFHMSSFTAELILAIFDMCIGNTDTSAWYLSFNIVLPFDTQSIFGWFLDWAFQSSSAVVYGFSMILTTTHFVCFCYYIIATCNHFGQLIDSLQFDCEQIRKVKNTQNDPSMWYEAKRKLQKAIELHINIHE